MPARNSGSTSRFRLNPPEESLDVTLQPGWRRHGALPDNQHPPPVTSESADGLPVAGYVALELRGPEDDVALWRVGKLAAAVPVPEAAVHEDDGPVPLQHDVWTSRQAPVVKPKPVAKSVEHRTDGNFRSGIAGLDPGHVPAAVS